MTDVMVCGFHASPFRGPSRSLTSLVLTDVVPWRYPAVRDFRYGEWLRADYETGHLLHSREVDPDLAVLLTSVSGSASGSASGRQHARVLLGPLCRGLFGF